MTNPVTLLLILGIVPLIWSALIQVIRQIAHQQPEALPDGAEKPS